MVDILCQYAVHCTVLIVCTDCLQLLEARQSVTADELDFGRGITIDMISDNEAATFEGVSRWAVKPPSFRGRNLTGLCATLQARLDTSQKYTATHRTGPNFDRMLPNTCDSEAKKR